MASRGRMASAGLVWLRRVGKFLVGSVCALCVIYVSVTLLLHVPIVQRKTGGWVSRQLEALLGTEVVVGRIDWGFLNRIIIDDFAMRDLEQRPLLDVSRMAVSVDVSAMVHGRIDITTVQLFGAKVFLRRPTQDAPLNCQFVLDAMRTDGEEDDPPSDVRLAVRTLLIRGCVVSYDVADAEDTPGRFNVGHLHVEDVALTAAIDLRGSVPVPTGELDVKRFSFAETLSGLTLSNLRFGVEATVDPETRTWSLQVSPIHLSTPLSVVETSALALKLNADSLALLDVEGAILPSTLAGEDIQRFGLVGMPDLHLQASNITLSGGGSWLFERCNVLAGQVEAPILVISIDLSLAPSPRLALKATGIRLDLYAERLAPTLSQLGFEDFACYPIAPLGDVTLLGEAAMHGGGYEADFTLLTDVGELFACATYDEKLDVSLHGEDIQLGRLFQSADWGSAAFDVQVRQVSFPEKGLPTGAMEASVRGLQYKGYVYPSIDLKVLSDGHEASATLSALDENIDLAIQGSCLRSEKVWGVSCEAVVREWNPHALLLTESYPEEHFSGRLHAQLSMPDLAHLTGVVRFDSLAVRTPEETFHLAELALESDIDDAGMRCLEISGDFIDATLHAHGSPADIMAAFQHQAYDWMPNALDWAGVQSVPKRGKDTSLGSFDLQVRLTDAAILRHLYGKDIRLTGPLSLSAENTVPGARCTISLEGHGIQTADGTLYEDVNLVLEADTAGASCEASASRHSAGGGHTYVQLQAQAHDDSLQTRLTFQQHGEASMAATLTALTHFGAADDPGGRLRVGIQPSWLTVNDTIWRISPSTITIDQGHISVSDLRIASVYGNRFLTIDGTVSDLDNDSLVADLGGIQVEYVLDLVDFHAVRFKGDASGRAVMRGFTGGMPNFAAQLEVDGFCLENANLGTADIHAHWDHALSGIRLDAHIVDDADSAIVRITDCEGYVAPASDDIQLKITAHHTNAAFLGDYLGSIFRDVGGEANGVLNVVGPLGEINLVGDMSADVQMTLIPTGVTYHVNPHDSIHLRPYKFAFDAVRINDDEGGEGIVNGWVTHRNVKNFAYQFDISMDRMIAYEEHEFNADKFMGKVILDGTLAIHGSDGHPLYINADCTPRRGSFFAYDTATPDAIASGSFITFTTATDSLEAVGGEELSSLYEGDIFMDISIHLTRDCDIRLRMDNTDDGYISTQGTGELQAHYHNKSPFTLQGTYNIQSGSYRLYLQEIIYRDLALQSGSRVVFNGNPFDADIHLICHHTLPAVPLSDLTADASVTSTGRAKVVCVLDITGKLGNMALDFDFELPNENEETKQLVRSLVYTPEERNMQMVYLLALGRFYSSEYARAYGQNANAQAMNNLLASTVSGQINQMLSAVIGAESNWQFGTGISTGDNGLEDLDVEGILSGRLFDDRLLINGNFGYRDNALTQNASFIGDFDIQWRLSPRGNTYLKAYNKANDRYFTKSSLNTQGIGISYRYDFDTWHRLFTRKRQSEEPLPDGGTGSE